ncbi:hypothetical protein CMI47_16300, partial [Candidatus Pacearchaeota archaeon]|nr:hypothetical protein [Candidatus Pacearchaeota archaeon]
MINVKNIILGIGIVIVFALVLWQGIETFYPSPEYEDFCDESKTSIVIEDQAQCEDIGGKWNADGIARPVRTVDGNELEVSGFCDRDFTCREELDEARDRHSWAVFIISLIVAIVAVIVGYSLLSAEPVGSALIASGVWAIFY